MTYDIYRYIFIGAAILCGIMLIIAILIFVFLNIPKVISDLSGATARRAIKNIREQNEATGDKTYKVSAFNEARGKLTDKISASGNLIQQQPQIRLGIDTTKIETQELEPVSSETTVLGSTNETTVLSNESFQGGETTVIGNASDVTQFVIEYEITYIHTDEIIYAEGM